MSIKQKNQVDQLKKINRAYMLNTIWNYVLLFIIAVCFLL